MKRQTLSAAHLYALFDREFQRRKPARCTACRTPIPFYKRPADDVSANWDIGTPSVCPFNCRIALVEVLAEMWSRYDLETPERMDA